MMCVCVCLCMPYVLLCVCVCVTERTRAYACVCLVLCVCHCVYTCMLHAHTLWWCISCMSICVCVCVCIRMCVYVMEIKFSNRTHMGLPGVWCVYMRPLQWSFPQYDDACQHKGHQVGRLG